MGFIGFWTNFEVKSGFSSKMNRTPAGKSNFFAHKKNRIPEVKMKTLVAAENPKVARIRF